MMLYIATFFAFALPIAALVFWKQRNDLGIGPFVAGAVCYIVFALGLENILHTFCLAADTPVSRTIKGTPWLYVLYGCLAAGIFEETGRLVGFKLLLLNQKGKPLSVAYGIGHGGIESILTLGFTYLLMSLAKLGVGFGGEETTAMLVSAANQLSNSMIALAMLERLSAMMLHIGLSILVYIAVTDPKKKYFFPLAILLHGLADMTVAMFQIGMLTNILLVEGITFLCGVLVFYFGIHLYQKQEN